MDPKTEAALYKQPPRGVTTEADLLKAALATKHPKPPGRETAPVEETAAKPAAPKAKEIRPKLAPTATSTSADDASSRRSTRVRELEALTAKGKAKHESNSLAAEKQRIEVEARQLARERAALEQAKGDPFGYLESIGLPPEEIARRVIRGADPHARLEDQVAELKAHQTAAIRAEQQRQQQLTAQQKQAQVQQAEAGFVRIATNEQKFPNLNLLFSPGEILTQAKQVAAQAASAGVFYDDEEISDYLESRAATRTSKARQTRPTTSAKVDQRAFKKLPKSKQNQILGRQLAEMRKAA
jgi:hypothetical protein